LRIELEPEIIGSLKEDLKTLEGKVAAENSKSNPNTSIDKEGLLQITLEGNNQYLDKKIELKALLESITEVPVVDVLDLKEQRMLLSQEIDQLKNNLRNEEQIKTVDNRILELEKEEKKH
jgi:hypothetical protein